MTTIIKLNSVDSVNDGDLLPIYSTPNSDTRKASLSLLATYFQSKLAAGKAQTQYAAPSANGFSIIIQPAVNGADVHALVTPTGVLSGGTITLPANNVAVDKQSVLVTTTFALTALTFVASGSSINGAPAMLGANCAVEFAYDKLTNAWYCTSDADEDTTISVTQFVTTVVDGVTSNQTGIEAAVTEAIARGSDLYWPAGTYVSTANIPNFHSVRHIGPGILKRGSNLWPITPDRTSVRILYVNPAGNNANDGLTAALPTVSIQLAVDRIHQWGPVIGRQQIVGASGTYNEKINIPDGLAQENNYLEFKFPSAPGVRGDPTAWPGGGAILDGTGLSGDGFNIGRYNKVYCEYLLVRNWYNTGLTAIQQVVSGVTVDEFSFFFCFGMSAFGNGWNNLYVKPGGSAVVQGGILDGARYVTNNTAGRLSFTDSVTNYTTLRNGLEYGLYAKHESSTVCGNTEFINNGRVAGAETYGAAIFAYKTNTSVDTRNCVFKQNNICYHARGGFIATEIPNTDTYGTAGDANLRIWKIAGFGTDDLINYRSIAARELTQQFGTASTGSASTVTILDNIVTIPANYFTNTDQYIEIEIHGIANTGTATVRPTFTSQTPTNFAFGAFTVAPNTRFKIRLLIYPTGAAAQFSLFDNVGATSGGATLGEFTTAGPFDASAMVFKVRGEITAGTLDIKRVRAVLWG